MDEDHEPERYAWVLPDFGVKAGTLADYAKDLEHAHYSGDGEPSSVVWCGPGAGERWVKVEKTGSYDDYLHYRVSCGEESATYRIDGRS